MRDAIDEMNGKELNGRTITVNESQSRGSGGGGGRGGGEYGGRGGGVDLHLKPSEEDLKQWSDRWPLNIDFFRTSMENPSDSYLHISNLPCCLRYKQNILCLMNILRETSDLLFTQVTSSVRCDVIQSLASSKSNKI
ncbi:hypothetical protein HID58_030217 [Brassica napus]|uniref:RRM domain-containing protein n=1 Tax=Brassica napus TaxID=3708 RepID=A0ABQ8CHG7_BRANA|nr:hypothetical protein HID58_030217 [Brassica napus]